MKSLVFSSTKSRFTIPLLIVTAFILRVWQLHTVPPSLYWEEVALGYDAYSILKTGKDHHGNPFPVVAFESFGDFKPSLYFYTVVPFIFIFGLETIAVRLPSAIAGTITVWVIGKLSRELSKEIFLKISEASLSFIQVSTMIVATFSPWGLLFSRGGWEANVATCLITGGIYAGYKSWLSSNGKHFSLQFTKVSFYWMFVSVLMLGVSLYTYHSARITAPLIGLLIALPFFKQAQKNIRYGLVIFLIGLVISLPLLNALGSDTVSQRFQETSIFSDISVIEESNALIQQDGDNVWARALHHRYVLFGRKIVQNAVSHFDLGFLFIHGDINPRHSTQYFGQLFYLSSIPLVIGLLCIVRRLPLRLGLLLTGWLIASILPASMTLAVPHALRILSASPVFYVCISWGIFFIFRYFQRKNLQILFTVFICMMFVEVLMFMYHYFHVYPKIYSAEWQYGYEQMVDAIEKNKKPDENIYITREYGRPAMYYWFYTQTDPVQVQSQDSIVEQDQGEFLQFENVYFVNEISGHASGLFASSPEKFVTQGGEKLAEIKDFNHELIWVIYRK